MGTPRNRREATPRSADAEDLLVRFRDGDATAFRQIVGEYQPKLVHFYYRLCWDRDRAEDFAQDLFMKLLRGAERYRPEGKLSTFVFRVATNLWIDHYRSTRPHPRLYSLDQPTRSDEPMMGCLPGSTEVDPMEHAIDGEEKARLREALETLTEPHRLVFELAVYQQLPYAEIGQVLCIPIGTVKSRMHNSVKALRGILGRGSESKGGRAEGGSFRAKGAAG